MLLDLIHFINIKKNYYQDYIYILMQTFMNESG